MTNGSVADWQKTEDGKTRLRRPYTRTYNGVVTHIGVGRFCWTAEEYDLIEELAEQGLTCEAMRWYFDPVPSIDSMKSALIHGGIPGRYARGLSRKPTRKEQEKWAEMLVEWEMKQGKTFRLM
jgi:hypothetical protein